MKPQLINPKDVKPGDSYLAPGRINARGLLPDTMATMPYTITQVDERGFTAGGAGRGDEIRQEFDKFMPGVIITQERPRCCATLGIEPCVISASAMYASKRFLDDLARQEKARE